MVSFEEIDKSLEYVADNSDFVSIDESAINKYIKNFVPTKFVHWSHICPFPLYKFDNVDDKLDFLFLIGSQAFCFWGHPDKWTINYKGKKLDGWWALVASFQKALEEGMPIINGDYLSSMT
ncbi:queuosine salvage family protein, partial [Patescibacteria group bacterium]